jgi:GNAT superfamily N-acetyltransferase
MPKSCPEEPNERRAHPLLPGWAPSCITEMDPRDPALARLVDAWVTQARALLHQRGPGSATRLRLGDGLRILEELAGVLAGAMPGEGSGAEREVWVAAARGHVQAVCSLFECRAGLFVELIAAAPWNLVGGEVPRDLRATRGAGTALLAHAVARSRALGHAGRLALQAENPRARRFYERLGFVRMRASDAPLSLVPRRDEGWSASVLRLACGKPGRAEARAPWMVLHPVHPLWGERPPLVRATG